MKIFKCLLVFATLVIFFISCETKSEQPKTAEELKEELKLQEQINPTMYLTASASLGENITQKPNLFHHTKTDGYILKGKIKNSSTVAKFKDVVVTISYLSETGSAIETKEYIMYKFFNPSSETDYEYKVYPPAGFKNFSVVVNSATAID